MNWKKLHRYNYYYVSHYPPVAYFQPKNMHFRLSVRCLLGVCWVSGGCQGPSGLCLRCINAKSIGKGLVDIILNKYRIFSQWPIFGQKRLDGPDFQRGVVGHFPAFLAIFFGLYGQVMDLRTYWGGLWKKNSDRTYLSPHPTLDTQKPFKLSQYFQMIRIFPDDFQFSG